MNAFALVPAHGADHAQLVARLSKSSVTKHFDAYEDIDWDHPRYRIDPDDRRFERPADCGIGRTAWYRDQPASTRSRMGLHIAVAQLRLGVEFESILSRGLLEFANSLPSGSPDLRYAYHEVIEEAQHSLMFQEAIARAGLPVVGLQGFDARAARGVPTLGRTFPALFFLHVLGGETPIDHAQRLELRRRDAIHPLFRRIMHAHVTEEARHISFARSWLVTNAPTLTFVERLQLRTYAPFVLSQMARMMLEPPRWLLDTYRVPASVRREAFREDPEHRRRITEGLRPIQEIAIESGILTNGLVPLWRALGIWSEGRAVTRLSPST